MKKFISIAKKIRLRSSTLPFFLFFFFTLFSNYNLVGQEYIKRQIIQPVASAVINVKQLADMEALLPKPNFIKMAPVPNEAEYEEPYSSYRSPETVQTNTQNRIQVASPSPVISYEAAPDEAQGGGTSGTYNIPPDTYGAVGLDKVFTTLNNNYRIHNKTTGGQLSLVSAQVFWNSLGASATGVFDPRVVYDPYNNRWLIVAVSNGGNAASRVLLGISQTHDPQGNFNLYAFDPDAGTTLWMDFPMLGFNKNWVAISGNMFTVSGSTFSEGRLFTIDYPSLLSGTASATLFTGITSGLGGFCMHPATTYSSTENTLYLVSHLSSAGATYKLSTITGTAAAPVVSIGTTNTRTGGGWAASGGNIMPQQCLSSCPGTIVSVDPGDQFNRSNVVFRNGFVWHTQTILPSSAPLHTIAQWTKITASTGLYSDGGRIQDATATSSNGGQWYGHPSIAVNNNNDVLVGFAKGESDGYLGAAYAMRLGTDAAGTMQDPVIYKDGEDYYEKDFGSGRYRWGDYSHTVVDPLNDASFWTIQEYAKLRAAPSVGGTLAKWGTWWAKVDPNPCLSNVSSGNWNTPGTWGCGGVPDATKHVTIISGQNVTLDINPAAASITVNQGGTLTINAARTLSCKLIVYGTLNITGGKLTLGSNDVFISNAATLTGGSSTSYFVTNGSGKVSKIIAGGSSFEFPVSSNGSSYNSLTIALAGGDPAEVFSVGVGTGVNPTSSGSASCVQRTWTINEMKSGGNNATLTFKWSSGEHGASFNASTPPYAFRHNGSTYQLAASMSLPVLSSGIYSSSTSATVSTFSPWIISSTSALPITLNYFTGTKLANNNHLLNWKASCTGISSTFELQRSSDSRNFKEIYNVNTDFDRCLQPFSFTDNNPLGGKNFYRLKMTDENGKVTYSQIVLLLNSKAGFEIVNIQPNPVTTIATLNISSAQKQTLKYIITDSKGSQVYQKEILVPIGTSQEEISTLSFPSGTYILSLIAEGGEQKSIRFIKQ